MRKGFIISMVMTILALAVACDNAKKNDMEEAVSDSDLLCVDGERICQGDEVWYCDAGKTFLLIDCAESGRICSDGKCVPDGEVEVVSDNEEADSDVSRHPEENDEIGEDEKIPPSSCLCRIPSGYCTCDSKSGWLFVQSDNSLKPDIYSAIGKTLILVNTSNINDKVFYHFSEHIANRAFFPSLEENKRQIFYAILNTLNEEGSEEEDLNENMQLLSQSSGNVIGMIFEETTDEKTCLTTYKINNRHRRFVVTDFFKDESEQAWQLIKPRDGVGIGIELNENWELGLEMDMGPFTPSNQNVEVYSPDYVKVAASPYKPVLCTIHPVLMYANLGLNSEIHKVLNIAASDPEMGKKILLATVFDILDSIFTISGVILKAPCAEKIIFDIITDSFMCSSSEMANDRNYDPEKYVSTVSDCILKSIVEKSPKMILCAGETSANLIGEVAKTVTAVMKAVSLIDVADAYIDYCMQNFAGMYDERDLPFSGEKCVAEDCISQSWTSCMAGDVYWRDSCGKWEGLKEECSCGCFEGKCKEPACSSGLCCDGCNYKASIEKCQEAVSTEYFCSESNVMVKFQDKYCSGTGSACSGELKWGPAVIVETCGADEICVEGDSQCTYSGGSVCTNECVNETVSVSGGKYNVCSKWWGADSCTKASDNLECLKTTGGNCYGSNCDYSAPKLTSPSDEAVLNEGSVVFCWNAATGNPAGYNLSLSKDTEINISHIDKGNYCISSGEWKNNWLRENVLGQTCKTVPLQKGTYYWHVQALGEEITGPWSAPRKIVVK